MDENKDGIVDRNEQKKIIDLFMDIKPDLAVSLPLLFHASDSDKDGSISFEEISNYLLSVKLDNTGQKD